jgi:hypothetical protein
MSFGSIYKDSWFGNANEANYWGIVYPFDADGSHITVDAIGITSDTTSYKASATEY